MNPTRFRGAWSWTLHYVTGFLALLWFLVRVIPKPSRAFYPCQRAAFPYASAFVTWLVAGPDVVSLLRKARRHARGRRYATGAACVFIAMFGAWLALAASSDTQSLADEAVPSEPVGEAKGIFPGRVVWIHDPDATSWMGRSGPWDPLYTSQTHVDAMVVRAIPLLTGETEDRRAWDAIFKHFNREHGRGAVGCTAGQRIAIKVSLDILLEQWPEVVRIPAVDDCLDEAALAHDPPSGTLYDPDGDSTPLRSLGVHEHWNNPADRQYSRNLGTGKGIELVYAKGEASGP